MKVFVITAVPALAILVGIAACPPEDEDPDGDGWTQEEGDCNEGDPAVYPGAPETCSDGVDNDCTGEDLPCLPSGETGVRWQAGDFTHVFEVGPGRMMEDPSQVPWESLEPDTLVNLYYRDEPYRVKWVINTVASADAPLVVQGIPENGRLPVISGADAVTPLSLDYWNENRSIVKVGGSSIPEEGIIPSFIFIENLDVRDARTSSNYTDDSGHPGSYAANAAPIHIEIGSHITVRGCQLHNSGNGLFVSPQSDNILIQSNHIFDNGNPDSIYEHNSYTEALGITFEFNYYGPLCGDCGGNNLKDRSAGTVIRYNWIEGGNRQLDLVEADISDLYEHPSYFTTYVYGNVFSETPDAGNSQIIHYGGDGGDTSTYRNGILYLYHNTIVSTRTDNTTLVRTSSAGQAVDVFNNIVRATAGSGRLAIQSGEGTVTLLQNWLQEGWRVTFDGSSGPVIDQGNLEGEEPGFVDEAQQDFHLQQDSINRDAGTDREDVQAVHPVLMHYDRHQGQTQRPEDPPPDIGAYELPTDALLRESGTPRRAPL